MRRARAGWSGVTPAGFHGSAFAVHVPRSRPIGETMIRAVLSAPYRCCVKNPINPQNLLAAAAKRRVGVKDLTGLVLIEHAVAGEVFQLRSPFRRRSKIV